MFCRPSCVAFFLQTTAPVHGSLAKLLNQSVRFFLQQIKVEIYTPIASTNFGGQTKISARRECGLRRGQTTSTTPTITTAQDLRRLIRLQSSKRRNENKAQTAARPARSSYTLGQPYLCSRRPTPDARLLAPAPSALRGEARAPNASARETVTSWRTETLATSIAAPERSLECARERARASRPIGGPVTANARPKLQRSRPSGARPARLEPPDANRKSTTSARSRGVPGRLAGGRNRLAPPRRYLGSLSEGVAKRASERAKKEKKTDFVLAYFGLNFALSLISRKLRRNKSL